MATSKLLISGLPNCGKTTLLQTLTDVLIIARDGKRYPFEQPHVNVEDFSSVSELIELTTEKIKTYKENYGDYPNTVVFDSFSKLVLDIEGNILERVKSFPYGVINTEIKMLVDFIERELVESFNVILVSHAMHNAESDEYALINAGGSWGKKGGIISETDQAIFIEIKGKKRIIHLRNPAMLARTTIDSIKDKVPAPDFNLQDHLDLINSKQKDASKFSL